MNPIAIDPRVASAREPALNGCWKLGAGRALTLSPADAAGLHVEVFDLLPGEWPVSDLPRALELSAREREILVSLSRGSTNHDIAEALAISLFTVKNHVKRIFRKIGVSNRTQAAARFNRELMRAELIPSALAPSAPPWRPRGRQTPATLWPSPTRSAGR